MDALVIGAGVIGLTTSLELLGAGHKVSIVATDAPGDTTSAVAAAMFYPYRAHPQDRVLRWSRAGLAYLLGMAENPDLRIKRVPCLEVFPRSMPNPWWVDAAMGFRRARTDELPHGYADGYWLDSVVIEPTTYLDWLLGRLITQDVAFDLRSVDSLDDAARPDRVVINCTGVGARKLVGDHEVYPIRGQVARLANPGIDRILLQENGPRDLTYIIPRIDDVICGGTEEDGSWDAVTDEATIERIVADCRALEPALQDAEVLSTGVGLRPGRSTVRLELDKSFAGPVIHNYGHGGSGYSLSWGCAAEVAALVARL